MKKLITAIVLLLFAIPAFSQDYDVQKWTVRSSAAYYPTVPFIALPWIGLAVGLGADKDAGETSSIDFPPYASIEALYSFNGRWSLGLNTGYCGLAAKVFNADGSLKSSTSLVIIPLTVVGRCNYLNRPAVKLYGSLEAGAMFSVDGSFQAIPDVQLNPIGVEFGRSFFGLVELGVGMNYTGARAGIGYRF